MKNCSKCKKQKPFSAFYEDKRNKSGFTCWCKKCLNINSKQYRQTHRKQIAKYDRKYRKTLVGYLRHIFRSIKQRCNNPKQPVYKYYGGRGIKCLFKSSQEFVDYVMNELKIDPRGLQIDRINNNGHYEKGNIRFVTHSENLKNRKR